MELNKAVRGQSTLSQLFSKRSFLIGAIVAGVLLLGVIGYFVARFSGFLPTTPIDLGDCNNTPAPCVSGLNIAGDDTPPVTISKNSAGRFHFDVTGVVDTNAMVAGSSYVANLSFVQGNGTIDFDNVSFDCQDITGAFCDNVTTQDRGGSGAFWLFDSSKPGYPSELHFRGDLICSAGAATSGLVSLQFNKDGNNFGHASLNFNLAGACAESTANGICVPNDASSAPCLNYYTLTGEGGVPRDQFYGQPVKHNTLKQWDQLVNLNTTNRDPAATYKVQLEWPNDFPGKIATNPQCAYDQIFGQPCTIVESTEILHGPNGDIGASFTLTDPQPTGPNPGSGDAGSVFFQVISVTVDDCSKVTNANRTGDTFARLYKNGSIVGSYSIQYTIDTTCGGSGTTLACTLSANPSSIAIGATTALTLAVQPAGTQLQSFTINPGQDGAPSVNSTSGFNASPYNISYSTAGNKTITANITATNGTTATCTTTVTVTGGTGTLACAINASPSSATVGQSIALSATLTPSQSGTVTYAWSMPGGSPTSASTSTTQVSYATTGTKTVSLTVTAGGQTATCTTPITVTSSGGGTVSCTLNASPTSGTAPLSVNFTGSATDSYTGDANWSLDFGDGSTAASGTVTMNGSTTNVPPSAQTHSYTTTGTFTARLTITEAVVSPAVTYSCTKTITVNTGTSKTLSCTSLSASPTSMAPGASTTFTMVPAFSDNPSTPPNVTWTIDFGDGSTAQTLTNDPSPWTTPHTYATAGNYTARVTAMSTGGYSTGSFSNCSVAITVQAGSTATMSCVRLTTGTIAETTFPAQDNFFRDYRVVVKFSPAPSSMPSLDIDVDYGDGRTDTDRRVNPDDPDNASAADEQSYTFTQDWPTAGTYTMRITGITDVSGTYSLTSSSLSNCTLPLTVTSGSTKTVACTTLTASPASLTPGQSTTFTMTPSFSDNPSPLPNINWGIDFGDGTAVQVLTNDASPYTTTHTYATAGTYTARLTALASASYSGGGFANCSVQITVTGQQTCPATLNGLSKVITDSNETNQNTTTSNPGELLTYTISYTNPGAAIGPVSVTDDYDERYVSIPGTIADGGTNNGNTVSWTIASIPAGGTITRTLQVRISNSMPSVSTPITNVATIAYTGAPTSSVCATSTVAPTTTTAAPFLALSKTTAPLNCTLLQRGSTIRYTITVENSGTATAEDVTVTDDIPPFLTGFRMIQVPQGATDQSTSTGGVNGTGFVRVTGFDLAPGASADIIFEVTIAQNAPAGATIDNLATAVDSAGDRATARVILTVNQVCTTTTTVTVPGQTTTVTRVVTVTLPPPATVQPATGLSGWALAGIITALYAGIGYAAYWILQRKKLDIEVS